METLAALLEDEGFWVRAAQDGSTALAVLREFRPDIVVSDLEMPLVSGWDFARAARRLDGRKPLMIAVSGRHRHGADQILTQMAGFDHFLAKPYDPRRLIELLDAACGPPPRTP